MNFCTWFAGFACALTLLSSSVFARSLTTDEKLSDLHQFTSMIRSGYGPLKFKASEQGILLDALQNQYVAKVTSTKTNAEFYYLMIQLVAEFKDSHFGASIPTTHAASVPFSTDLVDGKVLIDEVDRAKLPEAQFAFGKGDEVVAINGQPIAAVLDVLQAHVNAGYSLTARRKAAQYVTARPGAMVPVPSGDVVFTLRRGTSVTTDHVKLKWVLTGEALDEFTEPSTKITVPTPRNFDDLSLPLEPGIEKSFRCSGNTRVTIPSDATIIMMTPFVAYYHPTEKGNVGYLRIPHYFPTNERTGAAEFELRLQQYIYALSILEKNTVGLIIDQDHNCGGSVTWLHQMVSLFMPTEFKPIQFKLLANKQEYLEFKSWAEGLNAHTIEYANIMNTIKLVSDAWKNGDFMTRMTSIDGDETFLPNSRRYTKPIVITIDEMSGSGGDAFPAMMQGLGRAKLLGTRTMGAGGHVTEQPALFYSRISLRMTKSLFFRPDGVAVENNGAVPDYPYTITRDDFAYGYRNYRAFYLSKLLEQLK